MSSNSGYCLITSIQCFFVGLQLMKSYLSSNLKLGILGGGQLGKMLLQCTQTWDIHTVVLDPSPHSPCQYLCNEFVLGNFNDYDTVMAFGQKVDLITIEIEHVNLKALFDLEKQGKVIHPKPSALEIIKDKGAQKKFYHLNQFDTAQFLLLDNIEQIKNALIPEDDHQQALLQFPFVQKLRQSGYDGKGVQVINNTADLDKLMEGPSVIEKMVNIKREIAIIVARNEQGEIATYPPIEMDFVPEANLLDLLLYPANIAATIETKAIETAKTLIQSMDICGLLAVEFFIDNEDNLVVNEVAPRPHNSGHQTIESAYTSQYEQHIRAVLNMPLGSTKTKIPSVMVNLLGEPNFTGLVKYDGLYEVLQKEGVKVHIYGKKETRPMRKMGHVTVMHTNIIEAKKIALWVKQTLKVVSQ
jgi:5-(carboxyamino)imidazole ribonucleotide synthase